jgi:CxxC-x17-CxxC domain-containing protein
MGFSDKELLCVRCGTAFLFTAGEQEFYRFKGYQHYPKICTQCRSFLNGQMGKRKTETAVKCAECGVDTTVPFKPTGRRPVLCRACYQLNKDKQSNPAEKSTTLT